VQDVWRAPGFLAVLCPHKEIPLPPTYYFAPACSVGVYHCRQQEGFISTNLWVSSVKNLLLCSSIPMEIFTTYPFFLSALEYLSIFFIA
jgi:hypothetical protein